MSDLTTRLLAVDLDGTLLDSSGRLPSANRDALHRAHQAGMRVVLCTGRSFTETRGVLDQIGLDLDATVTVGGALLTDARTGRTLRATPMDAALADDLTRWLLELGNTVLWLHDASEAGFDGFAIDGRRRHPAVDRWIEKTPCVIRAAAAPPIAAPPTLRVTVVESDASLREIARRLIERFGSRVNFNVIEVRSLGFTVLEIFTAPVDKWFGIAGLCGLWQIDPRRTAAIGDDVNDLPMVRSAGIGALVSNASDSVRAGAPLLMPTNDDHGVAAFVDHLLARRTRGGT